MGRKPLILAAGFLALFSIIQSAHGCPFCAKLGKTLSDEASEAEFVAGGYLQNPVLNSGQDGTTEFVLELLIKSELSQSTKSVHLARFLPAAKNQRLHRAIFADVVDGQLDPFRVMPVRSQAFLPYLKGAVEHAVKPADEKLGYFADFLEHTDDNIAIDAYKEFAKAPYAEVYAARQHYDADRLLALIKNPLTPGDRVGLYGLMVGIVGRPSDGSILRSLIEDPSLRRLNGIGGLLGGYCIIKPQEGPKLALEFLNDKEAGFNLRYAALEAIRFALLEVEAVDRQQILEQIQEALSIPELSDLIIDELRKYHHWQATEKVLALVRPEQDPLPVLERAVLRFAIQSPEAPAKAFAAKAKEDDPQLVAEVQESLRFEKQLQEQFGTAPELKETD